MKLTDITDFMGVTDTKAKQPVLPEESNFDREELGPKKLIHGWEATPEAPLVSIKPRYKKTFLVIGIVVIFMLLIMQSYFLILALVSMFFAFHAMARNPLDSIRYEITSHGFAINGKLYYWDELSQFFFSSTFGSNETLAIDTKAGVPPRLIIYFHQTDKHKIAEELNKHIQYLENEPLTFADKAYTGLMNKFDFTEKK